MTATRRRFLGNVAAGTVALGKLPWMGAQNLEMERQIVEVAAVCDYVRARKRSGKRLWLSFDEWNVWYREVTVRGGRKEAPRLLEEKYDLRDALLVGGVLNSLLRHADRVRLACLAQLVNVIAPLVTEGDRMLRQTTYYPYAWTLAHARGHSLDLACDGEAYETAPLGQVLLPRDSVNVAPTIVVWVGRHTGLRRAWNHLTRMVST